MGSRAFIAFFSAGLTALAMLVAVHQGYWLPGARQATAAPTPGPIDVGFAQSMSLHHQQAIAMSQLLLDGRPTALTQLARQIAYNQLQELGEMRGWLRLWGEPLLPRRVSMDWMLLGSRSPDEALLQYLLACQQSPTGMSGLATTEELEELRRLEGSARDRRFLEMMLAHHEGGLPMARFASAEARLPVVRELATRTVLEQAQEVVLILRMLSAMPAVAAMPDTD